MFQLPGNLSGLGLQDCGGAGVMGGPVTSLGNNAAGARVGAVRGDNGVPPPGRRPGEGVRGDNRVPPPHPIHIQRQKQGKAPPLCIH